MAKTNENREEASPQQSKQEEPGQTSMARRASFTPSHLMSSPFTFMRRFAEDIERLFEDVTGGRVAPFFGRASFPRAEFEQAVWSPQVEVFEREGQLTVRADLPGLTKDDVQVEVTNDALTISGERKAEKEEKREGYYRSERSYGSFCRRLPLPEGVKAENATATFKNGVLEVTMQAPQRETRGRRLDIQEGEGQTAPRAQAATK